MFLSNEIYGRTSRAHSHMPIIEFHLLKIKNLFPMLYCAGAMVINQGFCKPSHDDAVWQHLTSVKGPCCQMTSNIVPNYEPVSMFSRATSHINPLTQSRA